MRGDMFARREDMLHEVCCVSGKEDGLIVL